MKGIGLMLAGGGALVVGLPVYFLLASLVLGWWTGRARTPGGAPHWIDRTARVLLAVLIGAPFAWVGMTLVGFRVLVEVDGRRALCNRQRAHWAITLGGAWEADPAAEPGRARGLSPRLVERLARAGDAEVRRLLGQVRLELACPSRARWWERKGDAAWFGSSVDGRVASHDWSPDRFDYYLLEAAPSPRREVDPWAPWRDLERRIRCRLHDGPPPANLETTPGSWMQDADSP